jgi:hypothetical protein
MAGVDGSPASQADVVAVHATYGATDKACDLAFAIIE